MLKQIQASVIVASLLFFSACGKDATPATNAQASTASPTSPLLGSWELACAPLGGNQSGPATANSISQYTLFSVNADNSYQELVYSFHGSTNCDPTTMYSREEHYGNLTLSSDAITQKETQTSLLAALSAQAVADFNSQTQCGHSNWVMSQTQSCDVPLNGTNHQDSLFQISGDTLSIKVCERNRAGPPACHTLQYQRVTE